MSSEATRLVVEQFSTDHSGRCRRDVGEHECWCSRRSRWWGVRREIIWPLAVAESMGIKLDNPEELLIDPTWERDEDFEALEFDTKAEAFAEVTRLKEASS